MQASSSSREARKAAEALRIVLEKVKNASMGRMADITDKSPQPSVGVNDAFAFSTGGLELNNVSPLLANI